MLVDSKLESSTLCPSFCDHDNRYQNAFTCADDLVCCQDERLRPSKFCCDRNGTGGDVWLPVHSGACGGYISSIWVLLMLLTFLMVIVMIVACTCQLVASCKATRRQRQALRDFHVPSVAGSLRGAAPHGTFDPTSRHAFGPPEYDELSHDPPKYEDVGMTYVNEAFDAGATSRRHAALQPVTTATGSDASVAVGATGSDRMTSVGS